MIIFLCANTCTARALEDPLEELPLDQPPLDLRPFGGVRVLLDPPGQPRHHVRHGAARDQLLEVHNSSKSIFVGFRPDLIKLVCKSDNSGIY